MPAPTELAAAEPQLTILAPRAAVAWSAIAPTAALAASRALFALAGRSRLRPLDQHFGLNERAVLVFGVQLVADAAASLVHLEDLDVEDVATRDHVLDVGVVLGLEPADGLAALADDESDLLGVDLDGRDPRGMLGELGAGLRDRLGHLVEDEVARPFGLFESASHDLLRDAGDLDVHLERRDAGP